MGDTSFLSLAELEAYDPLAPPGKRERRFLCPFCGHTKPRDDAHRCLSANMESGFWNCPRCPTGPGHPRSAGRLREWWEDRPRETTRRKRKARLELPPSPAPVTTDMTDWKRVLQGLVPLPGTPGAEYLTKRGIPLDLALAAKVRYHPRWPHWVKEDDQWKLVATSRRVVIAVRDRSGILVGVQGRAISPDEFGPKALTRGTLSSGAFATPGAWSTSALVVTEAPIDALSLHVCGLPTLATLGTSLPAWFSVACKVRPVIVATDADDPGDQAAEKWLTRLRPLVGGVHRLRPVGYKDWNAWLMADPVGLRAFLATDTALSATGASDTLRQNDERIQALLRETWGELAEILVGVDHHEDDALSASWPSLDEAAALGDLPGVQAASSRLIEIARKVAHDTAVPARPCLPSFTRGCLPPPPLRIAS